MSDEQVTPETTDEGMSVADLKPQRDENQIEAEHEQRGGAIYSSDIDASAGYSVDEYEYEVDEEAGTVATKVGTVGWPEGAFNKEGTGPGDEGEIASVTTDDVEGTTP